MTCRVYVNDSGSYSPHFERMIGLVSKGQFHGPQMERANRLQTPRLARAILLPPCRKYYLDLVSHLFSNCLTQWIRVTFADCAIEGFIQSQAWRINHDPASRLSRDATLCQFLLYGPSVYGGVPEDPAWLDYSHAVKVLLSNAESTSWLEEDLGTFLDLEQLTNVVESEVVPEQTQTEPREQFDEEAQNGLGTLRSQHMGWHVLHSLVTFASGYLISSYNPSHRQNVTNHQQDDDPTHDLLPPSTLPRISTLLYTPLSTAVCISNITTALGYVMLMNDPSLPQNSYIIGFVVVS